MGCLFLVCVLRIKVAFEREDSALPLQRCAAGVRRAATGNPMRRRLREAGRHPGHRHQKEHPHQGVLFLVCALRIGMAFEREASPRSTQQRLKDIST